MKAGQKGIIITHVFNDDFWACLTKNEVKKSIVELVVLFLLKIHNFQNSNCFKTVVTGFKVSAHSKKQK